MNADHRRTLLCCCQTAQQFIPSTVHLFICPYLTMFSHLQFAAILCCLLLTQFLPSHCLLLAHDPGPSSSSAVLILALGRLGALRLCPVQAPPRLRDASAHLTLLVSTSKPVLTHGLLV